MQVQARVAAVQSEWQHTRRTESQGACHRHHLADTSTLLSSGLLRRTSRAVCSSHRIHLAVGNTVAGSPSGAVMLSAAMFDAPSVNDCRTPSRAVCFSTSNGTLDPVTCSSRTNHGEVIRQPFSGATMVACPSELMLC